MLPSLEEELHFLKRFMGHQRILKGVLQLDNAGPSP
jgi:hypothetical protein